ncbi:MAG: caspase family protein, partial [Thermodesulfobacteriota bacterium]
MSRIISRRLLTLCLCVLLLPGLLLADDRGIQRQPGAGGGNERRVALVIGNGGYQEAPLRNPPNDAADMAQALRSLGFEVIHKHDANRKAMREAIDQFTRLLPAT